jgi:hypothetical protein
MDPDFVSNGEAIWQLLVEQPLLLPPSRKIRRWEAPCIFPKIWAQHNTSLYVREVPKSQVGRHQQLGRSLQTWTRLLAFMWSHQPVHAYPKQSLEIFFRSCYSNFHSATRDGSCRVGIIECSFSFVRVLVLEVPAVGAHKRSCGKQHRYPSCVVKFYNVCWRGKLEEVCFINSLGIFCLRSYDTVVSQKI